MFEEKCDLEDAFRRVFDFIDGCNFPQNSRVWKKADLFTLLVEVYRALIKESKPLEPAKIGKRLRKFYELVDKLGQQAGEIEKEHRKIVEYSTATRQATNARSSRMLRGKMVQDVINGNFAFSKKRD